VMLGNKWLSRVRFAEAIQTSRNETSDTAVHERRSPGNGGQGWSPLGKPAQRPAGNREPNLRSKANFAEVGNYGRLPCGPLVKNSGL
jgi:hypothetical protein